MTTKLCKTCGGLMSPVSRSDYCPRCRPHRRVNGKSNEYEQRLWHGAHGPAVTICDVQLADTYTMPMSEFERWQAQGAFLPGTTAILNGETILVVPMIGDERKSE
jgi:hypothetical protein